MILESRNIFPLIKEKVAEADPLGAANVMASLPSWNEAGDVKRIVHATSLLIDPSNLDSPTNRIEALAVLRDLGMLASSLRCHGYEPGDLVEGLEDKLIKAGKIAQHIPRDTVFSYGPWNPDGSAQRRFTTLPEEVLFISSFKSGMSKLDSSVSKLLYASDLPISDPEFYHLVISATQDFDLMIGAIVRVRRQISPEVFTNQLRPYFDLYRVGDRFYLAPGGAQMPILLIDQIIWGSDSDSERYLHYAIEQIEYMPVEYRIVGQQLLGRESLVKRVAREVSDKDLLNTDEINSLLSIRWLIEKLLAFRMPHLTVAKSNFNIRGSNAVGSGGYKPDILEFLIENTNAAKIRLAALIET